MKSLERTKYDITKPATLDEDMRSIYEVARANESAFVHDSAFV